MWGTIGCSVAELSVRRLGAPCKETSKISWTPESGAQGRAGLETELWVSSCHRCGGRGGRVDEAAQEGSGWGAASLRSS